MMTLPASPPITLLEIKTAFGGPGNLRSYLAGGSYVASGKANGTSVAIPSSGTLNLNTLLGTNPFNQVVNTYTATTSTLSGTENAPSGATNVFIEIWGSGGNGSYIPAANVGTQGTSGGGSGGYANTFIILNHTYAGGNVKSSFSWYLQKSNGVNGGTGSLATHCYDTSTGGDVINLYGGDGGSSGSGSGGGGTTQGIGGQSVNSSNNGPILNYINGNTGTYSTSSSIAGAGATAPFGGAGGTGQGGAGGTPGGGGASDTSSIGGTGGPGGPAMIRFTYT